MAIKQPDTCVVYRTGTPSDFAWVRSEAMFANHAAGLRDTLVKAGYRAFTVNYASSMAIGLPEGWEA